MRHTKSLLILFAAGALAVGVYCFLPSMPKRVNDINARPEILSGLRFKAVSLEGLDVRNVHIRNMTFDDVQAEGARFVNVTFENCTFIKTNFRYSYFENVAFINCTLKNSGDPADIRNTTIFQYSVFHGILFDNTSLQRVRTSVDGAGGFVLFKNMNFVSQKEGGSSLITGSNMHVRVVDSNLSNVTIANSGDENRKNSLYVRNSSLFEFTLRTNDIVLENCSLRGKNYSEVGSRGDALVTNCVIGMTEFFVSGKGYFVGNQYVDELPPRRTIDDDDIFYYHETTFRGGKDGLLYFPEIKAESPVHLGFEAGNVIVKNATLERPCFQFKTIQSLNLKNVHMLGISSLGVQVEKGLWENVVIEPILLGVKSTFKNIQAYNLQFPKGNSWRTEGTFTFEVTESPVPFEWEEIAIPTPEEMGLVWWPEKDPGYRPDYVPLPQAREG